jgi:hypothetical protein
VQEDPTTGRLDGDSRLYCVSVMLNNLRELYIAILKNHSCSESDYIIPPLIISASPYQIDGLLPSILLFAPRVLRSTTVFDIT